MRQRVVGRPKTRWKVSLWEVFYLTRSLLIKQDEEEGEQFVIYILINNYYTSAANYNYVEEEDENNKYGKAEGPILCSVTPVQRMFSVYM